MTPDTREETAVETPVETDSVNSLLLQYACDTRLQFQQWLLERHQVELDLTPYATPDDTNLDPIDATDIHPYFQLVILPVVSVTVFALAALTNLTIHWLVV